MVTDPLTELSKALAILATMRRRVICPPELEERIRAMIEAEGLSAFFSVTPSSAVPPNRVYILKLTETAKSRYSQHGNVDDGGAALP